MKKIMIAVTFITAALNIVSCNPKELLRPGLESYSISTVGDTTVKNRDDKAIKNKVGKYYKAGFFENSVVGDTVLSYNAPKKLKPVKLPNLSIHKNNNIPELKGKAFKMVAAGSNLMQGMRDGGIFNEGMLTSYPNLIANQMGIDFNNPLFDAIDFNGSGKKVFTNSNPTAGPVAKQKGVVNNLGYDIIKDVNSGIFYEYTRLKKFKGLTDNYLVKINNDQVSPDENSQRIIQAQTDVSIGIYGNLIGGLNNGNKKFDFILFENGLQDIINGQSFANGQFSKYVLSDLQKIKVNTKFDYNSGTPFDVINSSELYSSIFKFLVSQQLNRGIIINCPDLEDLPYYRTNYLPQIKKIEETFKVNTGLSQFVLVLGNQQIDSLLSPRVNINSKPFIDQRIVNNNVGSYLTQNDLNRIRNVTQLKNENSKILSQYANMPIFDINIFYKNILKGLVITADGIKVDAKWPGGNFYSSDGVYPTAFGQAVIANEIIKIMNSFYKMDVPQITTAEYLK
jgi:hypothetical protein